MQCQGMLGLPLYYAPFIGYFIADIFSYCLTIIIQGWQQLLYNRVGYFQVLHLSFMYYYYFDNTYFIIIYKFAFISVLLLEYMHKEIIAYYDIVATFLEL